MKTSEYAKTGFELKPGMSVGTRLSVIEKIGSGSEGEVYKALEAHTGKVRAVKVYYPDRNPKFKVSARYARKLDKLRGCPIVMDYLSHEVVWINGEEIACLISEFIDGEKLGDFISKQRGKRLGGFPAIHLLYSIVRGVEAIHQCGEYHGDLHVDNVMIKRFGLEFDLKIIDMHHWGDSKQDNREEDIMKMVKLFYVILGGAKKYPQVPASLKYIIGGLKRSLVLKRFRTVTELRYYLEEMDWSDAV